MIEKKIFLERAISTAPERKFVLVLPENSTLSDVITVMNGLSITFSFSSEPCHESLFVEAHPEFFPQVKDSDGGE